jgi:hypothetical protein
MLRYCSFGPIQLTARVTLFLFALLIPLPGSANEDAVLTEVLSHFNAAMAPPIQYRIRKNSLETLVSQKRLPNGVLATRVEAVAPSQTVSISLGDQDYDILPLSKVVIDKNAAFLGKKKVRLPANDLSTCFVPQMPLDAVTASQQIVLVTRDETEYYEIKTQFSSRLIDKSKKMPEALKALVHSNEMLLIEKNTYLPKTVVYFSVAGSSIARFEYLEITKSPVLNDDIFSIPPDYLIKTPASQKEYFEMHLELRKADQPDSPLPFNQFFAIRHEPRRATIDEATGLAVPPGMTIEQVKTEVDSRLAQSIEVSSNKEHMKSSRVRTTIFLANLLVVALVLLYYLSRNVRPVKNR